MGSSDAVAFLEGDCYLLLAVRDAAGCTLEVDLDDWRAATPGVFDADGRLHDTELSEDRTYVLTLRDLPGEYSFATLFSRRLDVGVRLVRDGATVAETRTPLEVYDVAQMGSLYERIVTELVVPDTERQVPGLSHAYHPGSRPADRRRQAQLYTRALVGDIVHKRRNLADPGWLVRVGLYLDLTALGIIEGVDPSASSPAGARGARRIDTASSRSAPDQPRRVGEGLGAARLAVARPAAHRAVAAQNLLAKRRATLQFLHVHHQDLAAGDRARRAEPAQRAGDLAPGLPRRRAGGPAPDPTRSRTGRPAVEVRNRALAPARAGSDCASRAIAPSCSATRTACSARPATISGLDEPGRREWARRKEPMDHTGDEAIPRGLEPSRSAHLYQPSRVAVPSGATATTMTASRSGRNSPRGTSRRCACSPTCSRARCRSRSCARTRSCCWPARRGR